MNSHGTCRFKELIVRSGAGIPGPGRKLPMLALVGVFALLSVGCASASPASLPTSAPTGGPGPESTIAPTAASANPVSEVAGASPADADTPDVSTGPKTVTITEGSTARYLVREQLANLDLPIDAIGQTSQVSGAIAFDSTGKILSENSRIVVNLDGLTSDKERRDNFLRTSSLESRDFPTAEFVVKDTPGLAWPLPMEGEASFQLVGDMTIRGVSRTQTWDATARFDGGTLTGQARTNFPFEKFDLEVPRVRIVLSVDNNIRLELEFNGKVS